MFAGAEHAPSTEKTYERYQTYFVRFMCRAGLQAAIFDGEEAHLLLYVTHLARTCQPSTIAGYLQGVKQFFVDAGLPDPLRADRAPPLTAFWKVIQGIRRLRSSPVIRKLPIERWMLVLFQQQLQRWGDLQTHTMHLAVLTAQVVAWQGMYRISNIGVPTASMPPTDLHMLRREDVWVDLSSYCLLVTTRWSKTNQRGDRTHTSVVAGQRGSPVDAVGLYCALLARVPTVPGGQHAFSYLDSRGRIVSLSADAFVEYTKRLAIAVGLPSENVSGRSFRHGGATAAFRAGVPGELIQRQGDWISTAYLAYIDMTPAQQLAASRRMIGG